MHMVSISIKRLVCKNGQEISGAMLGFQLVGISSGAEDIGLSHAITGKLTGDDAYVWPLDIYIPPRDRFELRYVSSPVGADVDISCEVMGAPVDVERVSALTI